MQRKLLLSLALLFSFFSEVWAQGRTVTGKVTDGASNGLGLPGVTVLVKGTSAGASTDVNGNYSISVPENANVLTFSFVGYLSEERTIGSSATVNVTLNPDNKTLSEVVVVGYGTQQKRDVTSSISQVKGDAIANLATPSFAQQLAGRASGVQVTQPSGILGAPPAIRVRGVNSITGGTGPLYIIDGVPAFSGDVGTFTSANALADINPNDIESFEILKDGAATAVYGSRASNGVVLITTKKGKQGQVKFNYDGYSGWAKATRLQDLLNASEFVQIQNEKVTNANATAVPPAVLGEFDTDWNDYVYRTAFQQNHSFSASAGTEKTKYYVSLGYSNQEGIARANSLKRYTLRSNLDQTVTKWLNFGVQAGLSRQENLGPLSGSNNLSGNTFSVIRMLPNVPVYDPADPTGYNIDDVDPRALGRGPNKQTIANGIPNLRFVLDNNIRKAGIYRGIGNVYLDFKLHNNLRFKTLLGADINLIEDYAFGDPRHGDAFTSGGSITQAYSPNTTWNWQNILSFNKSFNDAHNLDVTLVNEYTKSRLTFIQASATGLSDRFFQENLVSGTVTNQFAAGGVGENGLASYLARFNYNYKSKYYLGGSIRADGLSKLSPDNRWGYFPGASAAYRISEEGFFKESGVARVISDLRIRGSIAEVGNSNIVGGNYPYLGSYSPAQYGTQNGIAFSNTGNSNLQWESQRIADVGLDLGFLEGRFNFEFAYYKKNNKDVVLAAPYAPSLGIPNNVINQNIGSMVNSGLEFNLSGNVLRAGDFNWDANLNFSTQKNEITELVNGQDFFFNTYTIARVGESIGSIYGYQYEGVNMANGNPLYHKADGSLIQGNIPTTTYHLYDPANPSVLGTQSSLTAADKKVLGSSLPTWFGGLDNTLRYKNFDFNIFARFSGGNKVMNRTRQDMLSMQFENNSTEILGRWQSAENPGDGQTPRLWTGRSTFINNENEASSRFVEDITFLKIQNISLGYSLPKTVVNKANIDRLRIFAQLQNAFTFSDYTGLDPEVNSNLGVDYNVNPQQAVFTMGLNLGF